MDDVICLFCRTPNSPDAFFCGNCERSLVVGTLTSLGTGVMTKGFVWELRPKELSVGRQVASDLVIPTNLIANQQLRLSFREDGFIASDDDATGDCAINDEVVTRDSPLYDGDTLTIGPEQFLYNFRLPSDEPVTQLPDPITQQMQLILGIISEFHASLNVQEVIDNAVDAVVRLSRMQRGYAFFVDADERGNVELRQVSGRGAGASNLPEAVKNEFTVSQSTLRQVLNGNGSILVEDAGAQNLDTATVRKFKLQSLVCLPLMTFDERTAKRKVMGIIYADSARPAGGLPQHCMPALQMLMEILTSTIVKWQAYERMGEAFLKFQRSAGGLLKDLDAAADRLHYVKDRVEMPDRAKRMHKDEIALELDTLKGRVEAIKGDIERLRYVYRGL